MCVCVCVCVCVCSSVDYLLLLLYKVFLAAVVRVSGSNPFTGYIYILVLIESK